MGIDQRKLSSVILIGALILFAAWTGLGQYMRYALSGGSGTVLSISPDKKIRVFIKTPVGIDPATKLCYQSNKLFAPPPQCVNPHKYILDIDLHKINDLSWDKGNRIFYAWKGLFPAYAYNLDDPRHTFSFLDPYYSRFGPAWRKYSKEFVRYLIKEQPDYLKGFYFSAVADGNINVLGQLVDEGVSLDSLSVPDGMSSLTQFAPLVLAVNHRHKETVKFLLRHGVKADADTKNFLLLSGIDLNGADD